MHNITALSHSNLAGFTEQMNPTCRDSDKKPDLLIFWVTCKYVKKTELKQVSKNKL